MAEEFGDIPDIDSLFDENEQTPVHSDITNVLFIGNKKAYEQLKPHIDDYGSLNYEYTKTIEDAIDLLLINRYALVILDNDDPDMDIITSSRVVRVNHPLARIAVISKSRGSLFIADIINQGSVDAYIAIPQNRDEIFKTLTDQLAKYEIDRLLTNFVSQPPKLSAASYLLLDPELSAGEDEPVKFVGIMIAYKSVPRFSRFFEETLAKDEILFAGYLSGITMLGKELLETKQPLKEIHFGGVSVVFRFYDELQFSIFVRNVSRRNYIEAEQIIDSIVQDLYKDAGEGLSSVVSVSGKTIKTVDKIIHGFVQANEHVKYKKELEKKETSLEGQSVLIYGTNKNDLRNMRRYLGRNEEYNVFSASKEIEAKTVLEREACSVLIMDSDLEKTQQSPIGFAEFIRDQLPYIQVIYLVRDRRASTPIIQSLNSGSINYLLSYRTTRKELKKWVNKALTKAVDLRLKSSTGEALSTSLDKAIIAKTMIRKNQYSFIEEDVPVLDGIFISREEKPLFQRFWDTGNKISFNEYMLAGLVASLDSVGEEMFHDQENVGELELGDSNILVEHREDYNVAFFIQNVSSHFNDVLKKHLPDYADRLFEIIRENADDLESSAVHAQFDTIANGIFSDFDEVLTSE